MSTDPSPLPDVSDALPTEAEYDAIYAELARTERGRRFLSEYASRNRHADTRMLVGAIARVEAALRGEPPQIPVALASDLVDLAMMVERAEALAAASAGAAAPDTLAAFERIQDVAFALRERNVEADLCDALEAAIRATGATIARVEATTNDARSAGALLGDLAGRVKAMIAVAAAVPGAAPAVVGAVTAVPAADAATAAPVPAADVIADAATATAAAAGAVPLTVTAAGPAALAQGAIENDATAAAPQAALDDLAGRNGAGADVSTPEAPMPEAPVREALPTIELSQAEADEDERFAQAVGLLAASFPALAEIGEGAGEPSRDLAHVVAAPLDGKRPTATPSQGPAIAVAVAGVGGAAGAASVPAAGRVATSDAAANNGGGGGPTTAGKNPSGQSGNTQAGAVAALPRRPGEGGKNEPVAPTPVGAVGAEPPSQVRPVALPTAAFPAPPLPESTAPSPQQHAGAAPHPAAAPPAADPLATLRALSEEELIALFT